MFTNHHANIVNSTTDFVVDILLLTLLCFFSFEGDAQNRYTSLYNKRVVSVRRMDRPLGSSGGSLGYGLPHSGVIVTLEDGSTWLVHKGIIKVPPFQSARFHLQFKFVILTGKDYSQGSSGCQAVVTDDRHMSSAWREVDRATCHQRHRLGSYVQKAGCQYNLFFDNCWDAVRRMMSLCRSRPSGGWWSGSGSESGH